MRMRDGAERARPRRVIVKNILRGQLDDNCETRASEEECEEDFVEDNAIKYVDPREVVGGPSLPGGGDATTW